MLLCSLVLYDFHYVCEMFLKDMPFNSKFPLPEKVSEALLLLQVLPDHWEICYVIMMYIFFRKVLWL